MEPIEGTWSASKARVRLVDTSSNSIGDFYGLFIFLEDYNIDSAYFHVRKGELVKLRISGEYKGSFIADV